MMLESMRNHLIGLSRKVMQLEDSRTDVEKASDNVQTATGEASKVGQMAAAQGREDLQRETNQIRRELQDLAQEAQKKPTGGPGEGLPSSAHVFHRL